MSSNSSHSTKPIVSTRPGKSAPVEVHAPNPLPQVPAHERAARRSRAQVVALPRIPKPRNPTPDPSARKSFDTRILSAPKVSTLL